MFMRYYPKEVQPITRLKVKSPDRGRKHYWGYDRGDYGFYQSEDQEHMRSIKKSHRHVRSHTIDNYASNITIEPTYEANPEQARKNNIEEFAKAESIKLPSLSRISKYTQTTPIENVKVNDSIKQPVKAE